MKEKLALTVMIAALSGTAWAADPATSGAAEQQPSQAVESGAMQQGAEQSMQQEPAMGQEQAQQTSKPKNLSEDDIRQIQEALKEAGHDPGQVDGIWGPETEQALRAFEQEKGIESTGELNDETLSALGLESLRQGQSEFGSMKEEKSMEKKSGAELQMPPLEEESGSPETPSQ